MKGRDLNHQVAIRNRIKFFIVQCLWKNWTARLLKKSPFPPLAIVPFKQLPLLPDHSANRDLARWAVKTGQKR